MRPQATPELENNAPHATDSGVINAANAHTSQIPGLSATTGSPPEEKARGRRVAVLDTDSDYVKLAKQGGHKGLLWHEETVASTQNEYKPPNWFSSESEDTSEPSLIKSEEKKHPGAFQPLEPPFGGDSMSAWERSDSSSSSSSKEKNNNPHFSQTEKIPTPVQYLESSKFRRRVYDKRPPPVDMSKLLSFGYADDNKPTVNADASSELEACQCVEN